MFLHVTDRSPRLLDAVRLPPFITTALDARNRGQYATGTYRTPGDMQAACDARKTIVIPANVPAWPVFCFMIFAILLAIVIVEMMVFGTWDSSTGMFEVMLVGLVETLPVFFIHRFVAMRKNPPCLVVCPEGLAFNLHVPFFVPGKGKGVFVAWSDAKELNEDIVKFGTFKNHVMKVTDRSRQRDAITTTFNLSRVADDGTRDPGSAHWFTHVVTASGSLVVDLSTLAGTEFPDRFPTFPISQLIEIYWRTFFKKEKRE